MKLHSSSFATELIILALHRVTLIVKTVRLLHRYGHSHELILKINIDDPKIIADATVLQN